MTGRLKVETSEQSSQLGRLLLLVLHR
eukprot:COSAG06_NODE_53602_length_299_cov_0.770000_1_plen_26_part_01